MATTTTEARDLTRGDHCVVMHGAPGWIVREEKAVALNRFWRPEPDLAVVRGPGDLYRTRAPAADDLALVVGVAESSCPSDLGENRHGYAAARVPVYWVVDLKGRKVEVFGEPAGRGKAAGYRRAEAVGPGGEVPLAVGGGEVGRVRVDETLP